MQTHKINETEFTIESVELDGDAVAGWVKVTINKVPCQVRVSKDEDGNWYAHAEKLFQRRGIMAAIRHRICDYAAAAAASQTKNTRWLRGVE